MKGEVIMKVNPRRILVLALVTLSLFAASVGPIAAHHSTVPFDSTKQTTITGIVKEFDWTNPHTWIWINVPNDKGGVDLWGVEGMSPNYLGRRGWTKNSLPEGTEILDSVSSATRAPGRYTLTWDGKDNTGKLVKAGPYTMYIEAAREHGTYQIIRQEMDFSGVARKIDLPGNVEIASASLDYHRVGGK